MSKHSYITNGTCSRKIEFEMSEDNKVSKIRFEGGCNGNLQGIGRLCEGMDAEELVKKLSGVKCGMKATSCPDQLSKAIIKALADKKSGK